MKGVKVSGPDLFVGDHAVAFETLEDLALQGSPHRSKTMLTGRPEARGPSATAARAKAGIPAPVVRYAPLVYLHPKENNFPASADFFIKYSSLRWAHDSGCGDHEIAGRGSVSASKLGSGGYSHSTSGGPPFCKHNDDNYTTRDKTAPRKGDVSAEGFFLDLDNSKRGGQGTSAPVYYEYKSRHYVVYWFFYCYNEKSLLNHEGDWENITVHLNGKNSATEVAYYGHGDPTIVPWSRVRKHRGTHPVVYSALGSHASYPKAGNYSLVGGLASDYAERGPAWRTWKHLSSVRQSWYGYGGGWGEVGNISDTSGPTGPGHKLPVPSGW